MNIQLRQLKIKIKHLALEPAIIRAEERKELSQVAYYRSRQELKNEKSHHWDYLKLYQHRKQVVRPEARAAQLAYAFIRGKKYEQVENTKPLYEKESNGVFHHYIDADIKRLVLRTSKIVAKYKYWLSYNISQDDPKFKTVHDKIKEWIGYEVN